MTIWLYLGPHLERGAGEPDRCAGDEPEAEHGFLWLLAAARKIDPCAEITG